MLERLGIQQARAAAEPSIDLLQGNEIGAKLANDCRDARGIELPIRTNTLMDIVGRDPQLMPVSCGAFSRVLGTGPDALRDAIRSSA
ncbi:hypothetical protein [Dankookia sp. P2]|uniref:hypothetical protein n=1 Tax=Dankookia sp. P2 TaxID=3423955 RepID=UPI003D67215D